MADLDMLEQLSAAALKQREWRDEVQRLAGRPDDEAMSDAKAAEAHYADRIVEIVRDELDAPALLREVKLGRAAREVADAVVAADDAAFAHAYGGYRPFGTNGTAERGLETLQAFMAARARYRALLETKDA